MGIDCHIARSFIRNCVTIHIYLTPLPESWSFEEGAAYLVQVLTAYYGLKELGNIKKNQTILIHSAGGGVGIWANRICKQLSAFTLGTVGSVSKLSMLNDEGFDRGIVRQVKTFKNDVRDALDGRQLNLIMECIGGSILKQGYDLLGPTGRLIVYGSAHYGERKDRPNYFKLIPKYLTRPRIVPQDMIAENKSVMAFNLIYLFEHVALMYSLLSELERLDLGKPIIGHRFQFEEIPEAIRYFQSGKTIGKVVINI